MKDIITITTEDHLNDRGFSSDGHYNITKHGESFVYAGKDYVYHSSGLARTVYVSDCGKWVIKVPNARKYFVDDYELFMNSIEDFEAYADPCIHHNYYEAKAYEACPDEYKGYLAKTELLPNCWVRQEFVNVKECTFLGRHDFREYGERNDGSLCVFDFDPLLSDFRFSGFHWPYLPKWIADIEKQVQ